MAEAYNAAVLNLLRDVPLTYQSHSHSAASRRLLWFSNKKATAEVAGRKLEVVSGLLGKLL